MSGRPLRFLSAAAIGWVAWRAIMLWPYPAPPPGPAFPPSQIGDVQETEWASAGGIRSIALFTGPAAPTSLAIPLSPGPAPVTTSPRPPDPHRIALAMAGLVSFGPPRPAGDGQSVPPAGLPEEPPRPNHWSGSIWMVLRGGRDTPTGLSGGQLGGSQAGVRVAYALGPSRRIAFVTRITSPINGPGREASLGVEWQPTRLPIRLVVEHRTMIDGGRGGPATGVIGGFGPAVLPAGFTLESYAQAGAVRRTRIELFVDGAIRVARPVVSLGRAKLDLGLSLSGGAQRDAARLDIGPSLGMRVPIVGQSARLSLDWRQRVAGNARPGSGIALTLGSDF